MYIELNGVQYHYSDMSELATIRKELGLVGQKHDVFATSNEAQLPHGYNQYDGGASTGGLFTRPGADPLVISANRRVSSGLVARLLVGGGGGIRKTVITNPEYEILTGVKAVVGETNEDCGTAPTAGFAKICTTRSAFGKFRAKTERVQLTEVGTRINTADVDRRFLGVEMATNPMIPDVLRRARDPNTSLGLSFYRFGIAAERAYGTTLFSGLRGTADGFFQNEFDGFDQLIKTGYVDVESGNLCTAADSIVVNRASAPITSSSATNIVTQIGGIYRKLQRRAQQIFGGVSADIGLAMHPDMFEALTRVWAQSYYTEGQIGAADSTPINNGGRENVALRDMMRAGSYLLIRGERVMVYQDDGIALTDSGLGYDSDIYFIPFSVLGTTVTYLETFDMSNPDISEYLSLIRPGTVQILNDGMYFMANTQTVECFEYFLIAKPRLIMRMPYLAARLTNVNFALEDDLYQDDPYTDGAYHVNGGRYDGSVESLPYYSPDS